MKNQLYKEKCCFFVGCYGKIRDYFSDFFCFLRKNGVYFGKVLCNLKGFL